MNRTLAPSRHVQFLVAVGLLTHLSSPAAADDPYRELRHTLDALEKDRLVRIDMNDSSVLNGVYKGCTVERFFVEKAWDESGDLERNVALGAVARVRVQEGTHVERGVFLGGALGALTLGAALYIASGDATDNSADQAAYGLLGAFVGAALGGFVGGMVGAARPIWAQVYP